VSTTGVSIDVARQLRAICGEAHVVDDPEQLKSSWVFFSPYPTVGVWPGSAEEVAAVIKLANQDGLPIVPSAGSVPQILGHDKQPCMVMSTTRLTEVEHYDHADLTVGVGAGTTVAQLNAMVSADRLMFAGDPPAPGRCTIGGLLATAAQGPLRHGYGAVRDYCIGIRFVTGDGRRAKGGGRVVKNVAGYDLMKLLIGSYGTLAVITSASFKLFPAPGQTRTFLAEFRSAGEALRFRDSVIRSPLSPMCLELVSPGARKLMRPEMTDDAWVICIRAAGSDAVLARYRRELGSAVTRELEGEIESGMWRAIENFPLCPEEGRINEPFPPVRIQINVLPRDVFRVIESLERATWGDAIGVAFVGRVGVGHVLATAWPINSEVPWPPGVMVEELKKGVGDGASVKFEHASNPWPIQPPSLASMRAVKQALDPRNILRGREIF